MGNEMDEAATAYQNGDARAFDVLYAKLVRCCKYHAGRYQSPGLEFQDSVQVGLEALTIAAQRWDSSRGAPFEAYARNHIRWAVGHAHRAAKRHAAKAVWAGADPSSWEHDAQLAPLELGLDSLGDAIQDDRDADIVRGLIDGLELDAIGRKLGITKQAVSLRAIAIRERVSS